MIVELKKPYYSDAREGVISYERHNNISRASLLSREGANVLYNGYISQGAVFHIRNKLYITTQNTEIPGEKSDYIKVTPANEERLTTTVTYVENLEGVRWSDKYCGYYDFVMTTTEDEETGVETSEQVEQSFYIFDEFKAFSDGLLAGTLKKDRRFIDLKTDQDIYGQVSFQNVDQIRLGAFRAESSTQTAEVYVAPACVALSKSEVVLVVNDKLNFYVKENAIWKLSFSFYMPGVSLGKPAIVALHKNSIAVVSGETGLLTVLNVNRENKRWSLEGVPFSIGVVDRFAITAISFDQIVLVDSRSRSMRLLRRSNNVWGFSHNLSLVIGDIGSPSITALSSKEIALVESRNNTLRTYQLSPTGFKAVGGLYDIVNDEPRITLEIDANLDRYLVEAGVWKRGLPDEPNIEKPIFTQTRPTFIPPTGLALIAHSDWSEDRVDSDIVAISSDGVLYKDGRLILNQVEAFHFSATGTKTSTGFLKWGIPPIQPKDADYGEEPSPPIDEEPPIDDEGEEDETYEEALEREERNAEAREEWEERNAEAQKEYDIILLNRKYRKAAIDSTYRTQLAAFEREKGKYIEEKTKYDKVKDSYDEELRDWNSRNSAYRVELREYNSVINAYKYKIKNNTVFARISTGGRLELKRQDPESLEFVSILSDMRAGRKHLQLLRSLYETDILYKKIGGDYYTILKWSRASGGWIPAVTDATGAVNLQNPALTGLNSSNVALIEGRSTKLRIYRKTEGAWERVDNKQGLTTLTVGQVIKPAATATAGNNLVVFNSYASNIASYKAPYTFDNTPIPFGTVFEGDV